MKPGGSSEDAPYNEYRGYTKWKYDVSLGNFMISTLDTLAQVHPC